jgi:hypothetical protein
MAYLREINEVLCDTPKCGKPVTTELLGQFGNHIGYYCKRHGEQKEIEMSSHERALEPRLD